MAKKTILFVGTRKGLFLLTSDGKRESWTLSDAQFLGNLIYHVQPDPRDKDKVVIGAKAGHLGPTVYHSNDRGATWTESTSPPAFPQAAEGETNAKAVNTVFWISPGHASEPNKWYAGTSPPGLFVSNDNGTTWEPVKGFNENPRYPELAQFDGTPGGQMVHSVIINPADKNHMYLGVSAGGVFESKDQGKTWDPLNKGCAADFMPEPDPEIGHDPHCVVMHPQKPERLYQQNHCGIYRMDRPDNKWIRIGDNMPKEIGDIGFPIVVHPNDPNTAWVFPMDGTEVWPRTSPDGKPAVYVTKDGGESWKRQDKGLPSKHAYFTVKRQAMTGDNANPMGLYFGTSQGEVWASIDEGNSWKCLASYLPEIYCLRIMEYED
jgi:photosystem II stability/assembly factor-like uncharacterized protein